MELQEPDPVAAGFDTGLDVGAEIPTGDISMTSAGEADDHAAERVTWQEREAELVQQRDELTRRMAAVEAALVAKGRELAAAQAALEDERQRHAEEKDAWEADTLLDNKVEDRAALLELMTCMEGNMVAMRAAVGAGQS